MKYYDAKNNKYFYIHSSLALHENSYKRVTEADIDVIKKINPVAAEMLTNSSGIGIKFTTNSKKVSISVKLRNKANMTHMSAVGQCGMDLYVYDEKEKEYIFHNTTMYDSTNDEYEVNIGNFKEDELRKLWLFLPLYVGVKTISIGLEKNSTVKPLKFSSDDKVIIYGTSITQGACASRSGMSYPNILSRWLDKEIYNFGLSGSAFLEKEMARIIAKVKKPTILLIDAQPNAGIDERMENNLDDFINEYLSYHPTVSIFIASRIDFAVDLYNSEKARLNVYYQRWLKKYVAHKKNKGTKISFIDGKRIFKENVTEMTVDGIHPTDLGFMKISKYYYKKIK